jgi:hypothetical protein
MQFIEHTSKGNLSYCAVKIQGLRSHSPPLGRDGEGLIHTTSHAEAGGDRRKDGDNSLQYKLPSFQFLHSIIRLIWLITIWGRLRREIIQNLIQN